MSASLGSAMRWLSLLLGLLWVACDQPAPSIAGDDASAPKHAPSAPTPVGTTGPARCSKDEDCPRLACGPCKSGDVIEAGPRPACAVNPCPGATAICDAGICVVK
jgi:hypothetical protein